MLLRRYHDERPKAVEEAKPAAPVEEAKSAEEAKPAAPVKKAKKRKS